MKPLNIMKAIDSAIFSKIDELEGSIQYQKVADSYSTLEEREQDLIKGFMGILLIIIPLIIIYVFSSINDNALEELQLKKEMISFANEIIDKKQKVKIEAGKVLGQQMIDSQSQIEQKIIGHMNRIGVDTSKLQVKNFEANDLSGNILEAKIDVKFDQLTNDQIFSAISFLVDQDKMKIDNLNIKKNTTSNMLDGVFTVLYYSKISE